MAARLGIADGPVVCYQGAMVADLGTASGFGTRPWRARPRPRSCGTSRALGRQLNAYIDDRLYVEEVTPWARRYAEHAEVGIDSVPDLEAEVRRRPPTKLVLVTSAADVDAILPGLQERWAAALRDALAAGVHRVRRRLGEQERRARLALRAARRGARAGGTCGDGMNDVDMLRWAGLGVAVAEAARPVRDAADLVVPRADLPALLRDLAGRTRAA